MSKVKLSFLILTLLIFVLAVFTRIHSLEETFSFNAEYNYKLWPVKEIIYDKKIRLIGIEAVSYLHHLHYPPLALYIFSPILFFSGANPLGIEVFLIIINGVTAVLLFLLGKKLFDTHLGIIISLIYSLSFYIQRNDRFIWVIGAAVFFTTLFIFVFTKLGKDKKNSIKIPLILGFIVGLGLNFHYQLLILAISSITFFFFHFKSNKAISKTSFFLLGLLVPITPLLIFELRHNFYNLTGIYFLFKDSSGILSGSILETVITTISTIGRIPADIAGIDFPLKYKTLTSVFFFVLQIVAFYFIFIFRKKLTTATTKIIHLCFLLFLLAVVTFPFVQNQHYSVNFYLLFLIPVNIILFATFVHLLAKNFTKFSPFLIALGILLFVINLNKNVIYKSQLNWKNQKQAVDYILNNAPKEDFEIKFLDIGAEELDFMFFFSSVQKNHPYTNIHYIEPWHDTDFAEFAISFYSEDKTAKKFGPIFIFRKYSLK